MECIIKQASYQDLDEVAELFNLYRIFYEQKSDIALAKEFISQRMALSESVIYLARYQNRAAGFIQMYPSFSSVTAKRMWILNDLYVCEPMRKQGVARKLIETAKKHSMQTRAKGILLCTKKTNQPAQALYKRTDFNPMSTFDWFFLDT